ncbi:MAG: flagellar basal-body rod protein FlgF [Lysobacteraceae bacterium]
MFQALYNSLSGLFSFSRSLNTVSNNVSNMNTPGFRGSDAFFSNVSGGRGVRIGGEGLRTQSGDIRQTGNDTDVAVDGEGYFILTDPDGNVHYTRAGQFRFDNEGLLVDSANGYRVMAFDATGSLVPIDYDNYRSIPGVATTGVHLSGNIAGTSTTTAVNTINVFDASGGAHALTVTFTNSGSGIFQVKITDDSGVQIGSGEVRFDASGLLVAGYDKITANLPIAGGTQPIVFNFGTPGALDGMRSLASTPSNLTSRVDDGHGVLGLTSLSFDEKGVLQLAYSASERRSGPQLALARFPNESALHLDGGRLISGATVSERTLGRPTSDGFGRIAGGSLEMSNVDLTQEFADMIVIQRGYQASSRVMSVSNEMLDQLYNSTRGG